MKVKAYIHSLKDQANDVYGVHTRLYFNEEVR